MLDSTTVLDTVRRTVHEIVPDIDPASVVPGVSLAELGCNSIDRADVVSLSMEELGVSVPVGEFRRATDVGSLVDLLRDHS